MRKILRPVILATALTANMLWAAPAYAAPNVEFVNPSDYSPTVRISDKEDVDDTYDLVAWVSEVPASPLVEFELGTPANSFVTLTGTQVATDTWEAELNVPDSVPNGQYELRAILYSGQNDVDTQTRTVTVQSAVAPAETAEMTYPEAGQGVGFYAPPGGRANTIIEGVTSADAEQVRAFYSLTSPGRVPEWVTCGSATTDEDNTFRARCTLQDDGPAGRVTAVAVAANNTPPPGDPVAASDETGDAHRVTPYTQVPTTVQFDRESVKTGTGECTAFVVTVIDQSGQEIGNANLDVHAKGPDDQLRFGSSRGVTSAFQAPEKGHTRSEPTIKCAQTDADNQQGEHNVPQNPDIKHIESRSGTDPAGSFTFVLRSETRGGTLIQAWVDADDDDLQSATEASSGAQVGWDTEPPEPEKEILLDPQFASAETGDCQSITAIVKQGGEPLSSRNVDIHINNPGGVTFCAPEGSGTRPPDGGPHAGGQHEDGTSHAEGETDSSGQLVFGVTSTTEGLTDVTVWMDEDDDDEQDAGEGTTTGQVSWGGETKRVATNLTINYRRGLFSGSVGSSKKNCQRSRTVILKKHKRGRNKTVGSDTSNRNGNWKKRKRARKGRYYAVAKPKRYVDNNGDTIICRRDKSPTIRTRRR